MASNINHNIATITLALSILSGCNIFIKPSSEALHTINSSVPIIGKGAELSVKTPDSIIVCRAKQCAPANLSMSSEYIYNSLYHLLHNNNHQTALICEGNGNTHSCIETYITMPIQVGITPANAYIDSVKISDISINKGKQTINLLLNYNLTYNGQSPSCTPSQSLAFVKDAKNIIIEDNGYNCKMTTISSTNIKTLFAIDYIDLDYGFIGGYYSIGLSGPAFGGGNGYMIIRLPKDAYPLAHELQAPKKKKTKTARYQMVTETTITGDKDSSNDEIFENVQVFPIQK